MVRINGKDREVQGQSLKQFLESEGYNLARIAVEKNDEIVPKAQYEETILQDEDHLEVVSFVGGG